MHDDGFADNFGAVMEEMTILVIFSDMCTFCLA